MAKETPRSIGFDSENPPPAPFNGGNNYALFIGIDEYPSRPLENCARDVEAVKTVLVERYGFQLLRPPLLNGQATRQSVIKILRECAQKITENDRFLLYYAGHGQLDALDNEGYWILSGCDAENYASDGMANQDVLRNIRPIRARHILLLVDSCFSGSLFTANRDFVPVSNDLGALEKFASRWAITAGRNEPVSDGSAGGHSPFAKCVLDFLRRDDHPGGQFAISDLARYVKVVLSNNSSQTPDGRRLQNCGDEGGEFVFRLKNAPFEGLESSPKKPLEGPKSEKPSEIAPNPSQIETQRLDTKGFENYLDEARNLIAKSQLEKAVERISALVSPLRSSLSDDLTLVSMNLKKLQRSEMIGEIDFGEASRARTRCASALLGTLQDLRGNRAAQDYFYAHLAK